MTPKEAIYQIKRNLKKSLRQILEEKRRSSGFEVGLRHPYTASHTLLRDDGVVETSTGPVALIMDPNNAQATIKAPTISLDAQYLHFHVPPGGLYFGYQRLNPFWLSPPIDPTQRWLWQAAPIVQSYPGSLLVNSAGLPNLYLTASPEHFVELALLGITPVPFSSIFQAMPLFTYNEEYTLLIQNLGSFLNQLRDLLPGNS
jgi:hypothetical protein